MPVLDAKTLDADPEGVALLRSVLDTGRKPCAVQNKKPPRANRLDGQIASMSGSQQALAKLKGWFETRTPSRLDRIACAYREANPTAGHLLQEFHKGGRGRLTSEKAVEESEVNLKPFPEMTSPCKAISVAASFPAGPEVESRA